MSESTTEMTGVMIDPVTGEIIDQKELAERLLAQAKEQGVSLVGPGGLTRKPLLSTIKIEVRAASFCRGKRDLPPRPLSGRAT